MAMLLLLVDIPILFISSMQYFTSGLGVWVLALYQILPFKWAPKAYPLLRKYGALLSRPPAPQMQAKADELFDSVNKTYENEPGNIIEITKSYWRRWNFYGPAMWQILLQQDHAIIFSYHPHRRWARRGALLDIDFCLPREFTIESRKSDPNCTYRLIIGEKEFRYCTILPHHYRRFLAWKTSTQTPEAG